jgi:hypothetical protein
MIGAACGLTCAGIKGCGEQQENGKAPRFGGMRDDGLTVAPDP